MHFYQDIEDREHAQCDWHDPDFEFNGTLEPYLSALDVHKCPTFCQQARGVGCLLPDHVPSIPVDSQFSYSMNAYLGWYNYPGWPFGGMGGSPFGGVLKTTKVRHPDRTLVFTEQNPWPLHTSWNPPFHMNLSIWGMNDNTFVARNSTMAWSCWGRPYPKYTYPEAYYVESIATYHKAPGGKANYGVGNAVMCDGHVETVNTEDTFELCFPL